MCPTGRWEDGVLHGQSPAHVAPQAQLPHGLGSCRKLPSCSSHSLSRQAGKQPQSSDVAQGGLGRKWTEHREQQTCMRRTGWDGALCWDAFALHLYRSVLYFANLLLCSAAILPKERRVENQERTVRGSKLRKDRASVGARGPQGTAGSRTAICRQAQTLSVFPESAPSLTILA